MIRPSYDRGPARFECQTCGRHETSDRDLPEGWELRAAGHLHVQICGYCVPPWEGRPRSHRIGLANDNDTVLVVQADDGRAWIALDRAAHPDRVAAFVQQQGRTSGWRVNAGVRLTHWPMPELGGAAILIAGDDGQDGIMFTADRDSLADLIARIERIAAGLPS